MRKNMMILGLCLMTLASVAQTKVYKPAAKEFGRNIIAFNPIHLITRDFVGIGVSYERLVSDYLGIKVPFMSAINNNYFNIGIEAKLYPTKNIGAVKYAIAPTLMLGMGTASKTEYEWIGGNNIKRIVEKESDHFAFLLNQTLNITITRQFYIGLEGGFGVNYYDEVARDDIDNSSNISGIAQLHIGMGYRF